MSISKNNPSAVSNHRAISYLRVSSKEQEREGFSIFAQRKLLWEYAQKNGLHIEKEFEEAETAKRSGRTQYQDMVEYLRTHPTVKILLVEKTDRLYRNFKDFTTLDELDLQIHLVKEGEILSKDSKSHAKFIHGIKLLMAKNYIDNLSEEVKEGMKEKCEQGGFPGKAPVGYRHDLQRHTIELDHDKSPMIRQLFEWYASGQYSLEQLRQKCLTVGFTTRRPQQQISRSQVEWILKNQFYTGHFQWNGNLYKGTYPSIVSHELYERVQATFRSHNHPRGRRGKTFAFRGLLTCGRCGRAITAEQKKGHYNYYHCTGFREKCGERVLREEVLQVQLAQSVKAIHVPSDIVEWITAALHHQRQDQRQGHEQAITRLEGQYQKIQTYIDAAYG